MRKHSGIQVLLKKAHRKFSYARKKAAIYFYYTGKPQNVNLIHYGRQYREVLARRQVQKQEKLWHYLTQLREASDSTGCEYSDYFELQRAIKTLRPRAILECGSGISTCVIACVLKEEFEQTGTRTPFVSIEENPYYYEQIVNIFPEELGRYVSFILSERAERLYGNLPGCYYKDVPDYPYDFVFIDGPTERATPKARKCFNADFVNIVAKSNEEVRGLLDQRITTYWALKKLMPRASIKYDVIKKLTYISAKKTHLAKDMING